MTEGRRAGGACMAAVLCIPYKRSGPLSSIHVIRPLLLLLALRAGGLFVSRPRLLFHALWRPFLFTTSISFQSWALVWNRIGVRACPAVGVEERRTLRPLCVRRYGRLGMGPPPKLGFSVRRRAYLFGDGSALTRFLTLPLAAVSPRC